MEALLQGKNKLISWFKKISRLIVKRAKKDARKLKGEPPKLTAWKIIQLLA